MIRLRAVVEKDVTIMKGLRADNYRHVQDDGMAPANVRHRRTVMHLVICVRMFDGRATPDCL